MRVTEDPIAYSFSKPEAKKILYFLEGKPAEAYEQVRVILDIPPETFHRATRRLAQFDLIRIRAPKKAEFEGRKIRVVLEVSPRASRIVPVLHQLDKVLLENKAAVGEETLKKLSAVA